MHLWNMFSNQSHFRHSLHFFRSFARSFVRSFIHRFALADFQFRFQRVEIGMNGAEKKKLQILFAFCCHCCCCCCCWYWLSQCGKHKFAISISLSLWNGSDSQVCRTACVAYVCVHIIAAWEAILYIYMLEKHCLLLTASLSHRKRLFFVYTRT